MRLILEEYLYKDDLQEILANHADATSGSLVELAGRILENPHFDPVEAFQRLEPWQLKELCKQRGKPTKGSRAELVDGLQEALHEEEATAEQIAQRRVWQRSAASGRAFMGRKLVPRIDSNQFFVAYPYGMSNASDYRAMFEQVGKAVGKKPVFADEKITQEHLLYKIAQMILDSPTCIFDVTEWNPNVTLELGIAYGFGSKAYIAFDPTKLSRDVPADIQGLDRIQYRGLPELGVKLGKVLSEPAS
jgi:hypothetical protein